MFKKLLIANRGEIACRIIKTAQKMHIHTVAVYSEIDANALHVQMADESVCIGPAASALSYLDGEKIIRAALETKAEAIHPGYGFLSEDAEFAQRCEQIGLIFVGPSAAAIRRMGDKSLAKMTMLAANVPVVPGYQEDEIDLAAFKTASQKIGLPVLIKASAGGGGKGMRLVESLDQLENALQSARREAEASFGDSRVFLEKYLSHARHIEVQILFDQYGKGVYLFDRDCSVQRRHQKVIEEAPAYRLSKKTRQRMAETALRAGAAIQYKSTGTLEFLVDEHENFYFMEMNTRLQVEHPVTEMITGLDLVEWQLRIAAGEPLALEQDAIQEHGHAIELRLYAENPQNNFMPSAGTLRFFQLPTESSSAIRVDSGFSQGDGVSIYYDPLLAKLIAWGKNRASAIKTLAKMLSETAVIGIHTNWEMLNHIINNAAFVKGNVSTHFIDEQRKNLLFNGSEPSERVLAAACLALLKQQMQKLQQWRLQSMDAESPWFHHDGWRLFNSDPSIIISMWTHEKYWQISYKRAGKNIILTWENHEQTVLAEWQDDYNFYLFYQDQKIPAISFIEDNQLTVFCNAKRWEFFLQNPAQPEMNTASSREIYSPMPGTLIEICVQPGQSVAAGERLLIMEAMKMEHTLIAPHPGKIKEIFFSAGDWVKEDSLLLAFASSSK